MLCNALPERPGSIHNNDGPQRFMTVDDGLQCALERGLVDWRQNPDRHRDVISRTLREKLLNEPQRLLVCGKGLAQFPGHGWHRFSHKVSSMRQMQQCATIRIVAV